MGEGDYLTAINFYSTKKLIKVLITLSWELFCLFWTDVVLVTVLAFGAYFR